MVLHLQKLSVGSESIQSLQEWQQSVVARRKEQGQPPHHVHVTRMFPKRREELLDGGSIFWVIKGMMCCRNQIIGLEDTRNAEGLKACAIVMDPVLIPVVPTPKRPFQGWRYLRATDAPVDLKDIEGADSLPPELRTRLVELGAW